MSAKRQRRVAIVTLVVVITTYTACWLSWRKGTVLVSSQAADLPGHPTIVIRELPESAPFYLLPLWSLDDNYLYRFEFYVHSSSAIYSCQTIRSSSIQYRDAEIVWDNAGNATVFLDGGKIFKCSKEGMWEKIDH